MYDRKKAVEYAHAWAHGRNPAYLSFNGIGGDCTNFVSQCLYAGGMKMNYTPTMGWYYRSGNDRTPSWTGVQYLFNFIIKNQGTGPKAVPVRLEETEPGDIIQLAFSPDFYSHTLLIVEKGAAPFPQNILIACHSSDSDYRPLTSFRYYSYRCLKIVE